MATKFLAQIKQTTTKSLVSGDKSTRILLETQEEVAGKLSEMQGQQSVWVTVEVEGQ